MARATPIGRQDGSAATTVAGLPAGRSRDLFEQLAGLMPGGNTRTATFYPPFPLALDRGAGAYIWDLDGNRLIDLVNNFTSLVHGHAAAPITAAIRREAERGTVFPAPSELQAELAERIRDRVTSIALLRFTNSGTEANMHAARCARAATGRRLLLKAEFGYHGSWDGLPSSRAEVRGISGAVLDEVLWVDYNSTEELERTMAERGNEVAAIVLEPVLGCAIVPGEPDFFHAARRLADEHGALLVVDEVVTMRLDYNGYQRVLGVTPDLTTFGKVIGGGLPIGAFGGRAELMELYDPRRGGGVSHHGTFNGNSLAMAAGAVSLDLLSAAEIERINGLGARLAAGLRELIDAHGVAARITETGSLVQIHFGVEREPRASSELRPGAPEFRLFHRAALAQGVYVAPRGEFNITTAMDPGLVDEALARLGRALAELPSASPAA